MTRRKEGKSGKVNLYNSFMIGDNLWIRQQQQNVEDHISIVLP